MISVKSTTTIHIYLYTRIATHSTHTSKSTNTTQFSLTSSVRSFTYSCSARVYASLALRLLSLVTGGGVGGIRSLTHEKSKFFNSQAELGITEGGMGDPMTDAITYGVVVP